MNSQFVNHIMCETRTSTNSSSRATFLFFGLFLGLVFLTPSASAGTIIRAPSYLGLTLINTTP
jgi:hypothetical protein